MKRFFSKIKRSFRILRRKPILLLPLLLVLAVVAIYFTIFYQLPSPATLKEYKAIPLSSQIYDRKGRLLYEIYKNENRTPISLKDIPPYVAQASIAIEDKDFY